MDEQSELTGKWMQAWADVQRRSWEAWVSLGRQSLIPAVGAGARVSADPWRLWREGLERWQAALRSQTEGPVQELYGRLLDQGFSYLGLSEQLFSALNNVEAAHKAGADWMAAVNRSLEQAKDAFNKACSNSSGAAEGCMALLGLPMDTWRRVASSLSLFPGDLLQVLKQEDVRHIGDALRLKFEQYLSIPPLGYTRESQEQVQEAMRYWMDYDEALRKYTTVFAKVGVRALEIFQRKVLEMASSDKQLETARGLYDLWVDCGEDAYAEVVSSGEYGELSAALVNSSMALKKHGQLMVDEMLSAMNMPSRHELNTAHQRAHHLNQRVKELEAQAKKTGAEDLSRAVGKLREDLEGLDVADVKAQVTQLREELATLRASRTSPAPSAAEGAPGATSAAKPRKPRAQPKRGG
jgi:class III poly(R)-hydroxyalkanoic acid synthase PhaE subunit